MSAAKTGSSIIPCLRYRDAPAAIEWLGRAFGFEPRLVVEDGQGGIAHAQLCLGTGMIMLGSVGESEFDKFINQPDATGCETQSPYVVVVDADAHYERAKAAGAEILLEIADQPHGGRLYTCRDLEGHIWSIGSYDPWAG